MAVDASREHPNPLGKVLWKERDWAPSEKRSDETFFKLNDWSTTEDENLVNQRNKWDNSKPRISAKFPDTIGVTPCSDNPMV